MMILSTKNEIFQISYVKQVIEEDPILSATIDGGKNFTKSELGIALEDLENGYKRENNNIAKDVYEYFKDLDELIDKDLAARKAGRKI